MSAEERGGRTVWAQLWFSELDMTFSKCSKTDVNN
jgi:hypothetical protein